MGERPPERAGRALQVYVSRLRKALRDAGADNVVVTLPPGYLARVDPAAVDATRFETLVAQARHHAARDDHQRASSTLQQALDLWRGPALADVADSPLARAETARLEEARLVALEERVEADLACGRHAERVAELDALTRAYPLRERLWAHRMIALYRTGRQAEALRTYQQFRATLTEEFGLEPSSTLQRLEGAILRREAELDWSPAAPPEAASSGAGIPMPPLLTQIGGVFVGRQMELDRLEQLGTAVAGGERRLVLVSGEPGVGKSRLAAEFARRMHAEGWIVLAGRCDEDLGVPYQPFVEALRHFVDHTPMSHLAAALGRSSGELARLQPDLAGRLPALAPPMRSDPETERYRLFEAMSSWLAAATSRRPAVLVLDDLHWATKPTLLLLGHVLRPTEPLHLLVLGIFRDTELPAGHPLVPTLSELRRQPGVDRLALSGLDEAAVVRFMADAAGHDLDDEGLTLARMIHHETEGNPFFVREVIRNLAESGGIERRDGRWAARLAVANIGVPDSVRDVVEGRLARLSEDANRVLRVAAVFGVEFELPVVSAVAGIDGEALLAALDEAIAARLVVEVPGHGVRYRFAHGLVRDTLYGTLSAARRMAAHHQVAEAIESIHAALDDQLPALASHWKRAGPSVDARAKAVHYAQRAGDRALAQLAHDEATGYYASGLELLDTAGVDQADGRRLELLIRQGEAQRRAGDTRYRQTLLDAACLAHELGDAGRLARAVLANTRGHIYSVGLEVDAERVKALEAAIAAVGQDDLRLRTRLLANLGLELAWDPDPARRLELSAEALRTAAAVGDPETLAQALVARDYTISAPDNAAERYAATSTMLAAAEQLGDPVLASRALILRVKAAMELTDVEEAERCLMRNEALVADLGQPALTWAALHQRAGLQLLHGDPDAEAAITAAHDFGRSAGQPDILFFFGSQQLVLFLEQGRLGEAEGWVGQVLDRTQSPTAKGIYAFILAETSQLDGAARLFDELATTGFAHPTNNVNWLRFAADCAWLCARLDRSDCVAPLRSRLEPWADQLVVISLGGAVTGSVAFYLGLLCATAHDWPQADSYFAAAAATHERIGAPVWLARTHVEWARMQKRRSERP